jgi:predicted MPP superfamily phosphohydrolase
MFLEKALSKQREQRLDASFNSFAELFKASCVSLLAANPLAQFCSRSPLHCGRTSMAWHSLKLTRRRFLIAGGTSLAAAAGLRIYTWRIEPHWVEIVDRQLPIANLPPEMIGKTLVQINDLHIGPVVDSDYVIGVMNTINAIEPDLIAITGDFMTYRHPDQQDEVARVLEHLKPTRFGTVAILGNHDYANNWQSYEVANLLANRLTNVGIHVLRNESKQFGELNIVGLDDLWGPNFAPDAVMKTVDASQANLVLVHNPDAADKDVWHGYQGWILSGHTHGGQCKPPFLPPPLLPVENRRYTSGEFQLTGNRQLYINRGIGYLLRVRFNARPEITRFHLVDAATLSGSVA